MEGTKHVADSPHSCIQHSRCSSTRAFFIFIFSNGDQK